MRNVIISAIFLILMACNNDRKEISPQNITMPIDVDYLREAACDYATRYIMLEGNDLIKQGFLLDIRERIDRLINEVSEVHGRVFEQAFVDSVNRVKPGITLTPGL